MINHWENHINKGNSLRYQVVGQITWCVCKTQWKKIDEGSASFTEFTEMVRVQVKIEASIRASAFSLKKKTKHPNYLATHHLVVLRLLKILLIGIYMSQSPNSSRIEAVKHLWMWVRKQSKRLNSLLKIIRMWKKFSQVVVPDIFGRGEESGNVVVVSSWKLQKQFGGEVR